MTELTFSEANEFNGDITKLSKKYRSLPEDMEVLKKVLQSEGVGPRGDSIVRIGNLGSSVKHPVYKVRHFRCRSLGKGSRSGIRVIFGHKEQDNIVLFVEIYYKGNQKNNNPQRIMKYFTS